MSVRAYVKGVFSTRPGVMSAGFLLKKGA